MENEEYEKYRTMSDVLAEIGEIVDYKVESKILVSFVETILNVSRLSYGGDRLTIDDEAPILTLVKTFYPKQYEKRLKELKEVKANKEDK